jgi:hypothetical protein
VIRTALDAETDADRTLLLRASTRGFGDHRDAVLDAVVTALLAILLDSLGSTPSCLLKALGHR